MDDLNKFENQVKRILGNKYFRIFIVLFFGVLITKFVFEVKYLKTFSALEIYFSIFAFCVLFTLSLSFDDDKSRLKSRIFIISILLIFLFIVINFLIIQKNKKEFAKPDLLIIHNRGAFGNSLFSFKKDGTYIFYENRGKMEGKYFYGNYKIIKDTIFLNRKEEVWEKIFSDKLFVSNIYHGERSVQIFENGEIISGLYFVGKDNRNKGQQKRIHNNNQRNLLNF